VRLCLEQLAREHAASGFVLSVVGNLSQAAFQCPGKDGPTVLAGEFEIISLQGTLAPDGVHLHLSFSDSACQVWGGHLEHGTLVFKGADLLVGFLDPPVHAAAAEAVGVVTDGPGQPRVTIAMVEGCPYSWRALRLLQTLDIAYALVEPVEGFPVPQISIDGVSIGGYDALAELYARGQLEALR
jgi:glutaredoxin